MNSSPHSAASWMKIKEKKLLTSSSCAKKIWHIELELPKEHPSPAYIAGDHLAVYPLNSKEHVEAALALFQLKATDNLTIVPNSANPGSSLTLVQNINAGDFFKHFLELNRYASKTSIELLKNLTSDAHLKAWMYELLHDEGLYYKEIILPRKTLLHLMTEKKLTAPLSYAYDLWPKLSPRFYSISSSSITSPDSLTITVGELSELSDDNKSVYRGTCSTYLGSCKLAIDRLTNVLVNVGEGVSVYVKDTKSPFKLRNPSDNIIMVAAGTGLAPFRGFLQERSEWKKQGKAVGKSFLFFGCRKKDDDLLYDAELKQFEKEGILNAFHVAFSQQEPKRHVQHQLLEHKQDVWEMLENEKAIVYICGSGAMAKEVTKALTHIIEECGFRNTAMAQVYVSALLESQRLIQDVWG